MDLGKPGDTIRPHVTQRYCRDLWYNLARIRERAGDTEGAARARFAARLTSTDTRVRHDMGWKKSRSRW